MCLRDLLNQTRGLQGNFVMWAPLPPTIFAGPKIEKKLSQKKVWIWSDEDYHWNPKKFHNVLEKAAHQIQHQHQWKGPGRDRKYLCNYRALKHVKQNLTEAVGGTDNPEMSCKQQYSKFTTG